ncbi:MAG: YkgJ family cysteine cluster protein [Deltaproteobacteria bacterium]|nr:YkgJ family cysteine cluster protein [Deltaproteobacteria bacterium]
MKEGAGIIKKSEKTSCRQCGACCLAHLSAYITDADRERWRREGRSDILHIIDRDRPVWAGDRLISARSGLPLHGCPFLEWTGRWYSCSIYETRPLTCRNFEPGSSPLCPLYGVKE